MQNPMFLRGNKRRKDFFPQVWKTTFIRGAQKIWGVKYA